MVGHSIFVFAPILISLASGFPHYRDRIPNGNNVTSPCDSSLTWAGVGHINHAGGGSRNPFGLAFAANNHKWDITLCQKDSDGDGRTNGMELGDPDCTWTEGTTPTNTEGITHPGVCEPMNSLKCSGSNVTCPKPFDCPAIRAQGTFSVDIDIPETAVPAQATTYICMNFELPDNQEYHIVATTPRIDNINVMHHIVVYECEVESVDRLNNPLMKPYMCNMSPERSCSRMIGLWSFGSDGNCFNENTGFLVGGTNGFKYAAYQIHWNNPELVSTYTDKSGMSFHMTPNLRPYNAGILMVGQRYLAIPPGEERHEAIGSCGPACTRNYLNGSIYIASVVNHMHLLGREQYTEVLRDGQRVDDLAKDNAYDYNTPTFHNHAPSIQVRLGDEIKTRCVFSSVGVDSTTYFGQATNDEMCYAFLMYYPKENLEHSTCVQYRNGPVCVDNGDGGTNDGSDDVDNGDDGTNGGGDDVDNGGDESNDCDFDKILDPAHPDMVKHYAQVFDKCRVDRCTKECLDYVRVRKQEPCFGGKHYERTKASLWAIKDDQTLRMSALEYLLLMDSCDLELAGNQINSAYNVAPMVPVIILAMTAFLLS